MFILDGRPLSPDVPFEHDGISYPANWLRLASPEERAAIGITEEPDPAPYDQRFYWAPDLPKDHAQLVQQWTQQTRTTAGTLLTPTDWYVVRELDNNTPTPVEMKDWRQAIRIDCEAKVAAIEATTATEELADYITGADYPTWPTDPYASKLEAEK
jgi:hypothetical protein